jgi:hypothetical protein
MWGFELVDIYMGEKMSKLRKMLNKRPLLWFVVVAFIFFTAVTVYAMLPVISLNSPTSFPVDI